MPVRGIYLAHGRAHDAGEVVVEQRDDVADAPASEGVPHVVDAAVLDIVKPSISATSLELG